MIRVQQSHGQAPGRLSLIWHGPLLPALPPVPVLRELAAKSLRHPTEFAALPRCRRGRGLDLRVLLEQEPPRRGSKSREELETGTLVPLPLLEGSERLAEICMILRDPDAAGPGTLQLAHIIRDEVARAWRSPATIGSG